MNIIFLDIDGVLNSGRSFIAFSTNSRAAEYEHDPYWFKITKATIDPVSVGLLNKVLKDTNAFFVLSSTHRLHFKEGEAPTDKLDQIIDYMTNLGVLGERCIGYTKQLNTIRGVEIQQWLEENASQFDDVRIAILDDSSDFLPEQLPFHVHCAGGHGITEENYFQLCKLFGMEQSIIS